MRLRFILSMLLLLATITVAACLLADLPWVARVLAAAGSLVAYGLLIRQLRRTLGRQELIITAVGDGIASLRDRDYSVSITPPQGDAALGRLVEAYNVLGDRLRSQRQDLYQRELLLDTVIQASPVALVLTNSTGTILYGNLAARQLFLDGRKLEGCVVHRHRAGCARRRCARPCSTSGTRCSPWSCTARRRCSTCRSAASC